MEENLSDISSILSFLCNEVDSVRETNRVQGIEISSLHRQLSSKDKDIHQLKHEIRLLNEKLSTFERPDKDSHNSSIPPSKQSLKAQAIKRTRSLREKSGKPSGGQIGHKGHTLEFSSTPDVIVDHIPEYCTHCGCSLAEIQPVENRSAQVTDLPEIKPIITEHRLFTKLCTCGHKNKVHFPKEVRAYTCYGPSMRAHIAYLNTVQCIPYERLCGMLEECYNVKPSQGTIENILETMKADSSFIYDQIRSRIMQSLVVGADETGENVNGKHNWTWVWQTSELTYAHQSSSRGMLAIDKEFPNGLPNATLVTDRHGSYFNMIVKDHQICLAHLIRNLIYLTELDENQTWSNRVHKLLTEAIHKRKTMDWNLIPRQSLFQRLDRLLEEPLEKLHEDIQRLKKSLLKHRDHIFLFLSNENIPYDNNASERAIRIIKVKQKISGCFRSDAGANTFVQLHSISDTAKKNGKSRYQALLSVAMHGAEASCL